MKQLTDDMKEILKSNISYFATASTGSKPNVVPIGLAEPISDSEVLIVDVLFNKTRRNLEQNPQVAIAVTDVNKLQAYQFKGKAEVMTSGDLFDRASQIMEDRSARRAKMLEERFAQVQDPKVKARLEKMRVWHKGLKPKAVVLVRIEEIYPTM